MNQLKNLLVSTIVAGTFALSLHAENWGHWRGPAYNGSTTEKNLPTEWSKTNVAWVAPLPGYSGATPAVWGDYVFVSSPDAQKNLTLICFNAKDGAVRWQQTVAVGDKEKGRNNMASPSPVTDGKIVVILFGTGDLAAYDFSGKQLWARNLGKEYGRFANMWLYGASPLLYKGKLYIQVLQRNPPPPDYTNAIDDKPERESYLLCLDPKTGKNIYRHIRPTDALKESQESYASPIPYEYKGKPEILIAGGNCATAHDAASGEELWRCGGLNSKNDSYFRIVPSPVVADGLVVACAPKREPVFAIKDGGKGLVTDTHVAWSFKEFPSDCVTPLYYQKKLFVLDGDKQMITCLDPKTGEKKWQGNMGTREIFRASPSGADGKIYCISENGTVVILSAGDEFKILSTIKMGEEPIRSSIVIANGHLFIRTGQNLYCVGKK
ncbi:MAG: WD40-like repeat-like protein [Pedosphaera sp.]|nr:WD40-like repeat-like protein [Pedosphaera sp.]